jgi:hypothetical protein
MPCEMYISVWMALLGGCRLHGNMGLEEACVGNVVCYVICTIISKWDLSRILEKAWNRCEKTVGLVPYCNLWQFVLYFDSSMLTFHHFGDPLNLRLSLRHQATMRI